MPGRLQITPKPKRVVGVAPEIEIPNRLNFSTNPPFLIQRIASALSTAY